MHTKEQRGEPDHPHDRGPGGFARRAVRLAALVGFAAIVALLYGPVLMGQIPAQAQPVEETPPQFEKEAEWYEWYYTQRTTGCEIPDGAFVRAHEYRQLMEVWESPAAAQRAAPSWKSLGPRPITNSEGSEDGTAGKRHKASGRVSDMAIDYGDINDKTVYIAAAGGGVWKTTDGGDNWTPLTDNEVTTVMGAIALTRDANDNVVIYAGTGEGEGYAREFAPPATRPGSLYGSGVLKSTNGGSSWTRMDGTLASDATKKAFLKAYISDIAIHPKDPDIVFVAVTLREAKPGLKAGLYKSANGGATWKRVLKGGCTSVEINRVNPKLVWAGIGSYTDASTNGVYTSTDAGETFTQDTGPLTGAAVGRIELAVPRSATRTVYAVMDTDLAGHKSTDLYKTVDNGATWTHSGSGPVSQITTGCSGATRVTGAFCGSQCDYNLALGVDPSNRNLVYLAGLNVICNVKGNITRNASWHDVSHSFDFYYPGCTGATLDSKGLHPDFHAIAVGRFDAHNRKQDIYVGSDAGVFKATLTPAADKTIENLCTNGTLYDSWKHKNGTLAITQFFKAMLNPKNPKEALGGTQDLGNLRAVNTLDVATPAAAEWRQVAIGDGGYVAFTNSNGLPQRMFNEYVNLQLYRSKTHDPKEDADWEGFLESGWITGVGGGNALFIAPFVYFSVAAHPQNKVFAGATDVLRCNNALAPRAANALKNSWKNISQNAPATTGGAGRISALASAPSNRNWLYVGKENSRVYITSNGLAVDDTTVTFRNRILDAKKPTFRTRYISGLDVHPTDHKKALLCISGFGATTNGIDAPGQRAHVYFTSTGGKDPPGAARGWTALPGTAPNDLLPNIPCNDVLFDVDTPTTYYVATDLGVYVSTDSGAKWKILGTGLPNTPVLDLSLHKYTTPNVKVLVIATHGRGMWMYPL